MIRPDLFPQFDSASYGSGDARRQNLFIQAYLKGAADDYKLRGQRQDEAYKIICKWAELASGGKLEGRKESNLEAEFLTEVFGGALGYAFFSKDAQNWDIEPKYAFEGGTPDAAIGLFAAGTKAPPRAVFELKGPVADVDRDRSQGRTPVQQCWDYLNALPQCPWGIVCNIVSFRLYHRALGSRAYQHFALRDLNSMEVFRQFYFLFERGGLLPGVAGQAPRADALLEQTGKRQREVGDELYGYYHDNRLRLVDHLQKKPHGKSLEAAIRITQRLLDRIVFVAFCESRGLLPAKSIHNAYATLPAFYRVTNPRWQNFLSLFYAMHGGDERHRIPPFNGGLFKVDAEVDELQLDDEWARVFDRFGQYDFRDEVNVDVLGHLFERSVNDVETLRLSGVVQLPDEARAKMDKSAQRKRHGIYYTPPEFTKFIVHNTVGALAQERFDSLARRAGIDPRERVDQAQKAHGAYWQDCLSTLRQIKVVDPACGSGAFLIQAYDVLEELYRGVVNQLVFHQAGGAEQLPDQIPDFILGDNLFGVDLSPEAVEITQLALWIRSARAGKTLANLSANVVCGNSLVSDASATSHALDWRKRFAAVFDRPEGGFDCVIGNPPWERMKLQEREFFDAAAPEIAAAVDAAARRRLIEELESKNPELNQRYLAAKADAEKTLDYVRACDRYQLTGKGDINTYAVFAELASTIVSPDGMAGLLVPTGIATDHTTKEFFGQLVESKTLAGLYDFENKEAIFPDVHRSFKFCVLLFGGGNRKSKEMDFVFFAHNMKDVQKKRRHIKLTAEDMKLFNPNTRTCPIFRTREDAELTKAIYRRVPILVDNNRKEGGNPWGIRFVTIFHQTNDAELFRTAKQLAAQGCKTDGATWRKGKQRFIPLYEAKMVQAYDHRAASVEMKPQNWMRQGQTVETSLVEHQNPEFAATPRWWVAGDAVDAVLEGRKSTGYICFKDVTSPTNTRTMIAAFVPHAAAVNSAPLIFAEDKVSERLQCCLLANLNSFVLDFVARQKVGGLHLNFYVVEQLPVFGPDRYAEKCPWSKKMTLEKWISQRVLKLTCTSNDMVPLARAAGFEPPVYKWRADERAQIMAELDAAYMILYGIAREDVKYILSTFSGTGEDGEGLIAGASSVSMLLEQYDLLVAGGG